MRPERRVELAVARFVFGSASSEDVIAVADELLSAGVYTYGLGELGTLRSPREDEIRRWLGVTLHEMNLAWPSFEEAALTLVTAQMWALAEKLYPPQEGLDRFLEDCYTPIGGEPPEQFLRMPLACHEVTDLVATWEYRALTSLPGVLTKQEAKKARQKLETDLVKKAKDWLRSHRQVVVDESWLRWNGGMVTAIADSIAADKTIDRLPLLADALEDAGCTNPHILWHCRSGEPHNGSCWVVDLLRGEP